MQGKVRISRWISASRAPRCPLRPPHAPWPTVLALPRFPHPVRCSGERRRSAARRAETGLRFRVGGSLRSSATSGDPRGHTPADGTFATCCRSSEFWRRRIAARESRDAAGTTCSDSPARSRPRATCLTGHLQLRPFERFHRLQRQARARRQRVRPVLRLAPRPPRRDHPPAAGLRQRRLQRLRVPVQLPHHRRLRWLEGRSARVMASELPHLADVRRRLSRWGQRPLRLRQRSCVPHREPLRYSRPLRPLPPDRSSCPHQRLRHRHLLPVLLPRARWQPER